MSVQKCLLLDLSTLIVLRKMCPKIIPLNTRGAVITNLAPTVHKNCMTVFVAVDEPQYGKALKPLAVTEQEEN